jgi:hypothetical protein
MLDFVFMLSGNMFLRSVFMRFFALKVVMALSLFFQVQVNSIGENTAKVASFLGGVVVSVGAGFFAYHLPLKEFNMEPVTKLALSGGIGIGAGGLCWWILNNMLYEMTPVGRYLLSEYIVSGIAIDSIVAREFKSRDDFCSHVVVRFGTNWPLVVARECLKNGMDDLSRAHNLLQMAICEINGDFSYLQLFKRCKSLEEKIISLAKRMDEMTFFVINIPGYTDQVRLHEKHLEAERQRRHEQSLQNQQLAHDSFERWTDRVQHGYEKKEDREFKKDVLRDNKHRPVTINI